MTQLNETDKYACHMHVTVIQQFMMITYATSVLQLYCTKNEVFN